MKRIRRRSLLQKDTPSKRRVTSRINLLASLKKSNASRDNSKRAVQTKKIFWSIGVIAIFAIFILNVRPQELSSRPASHTFIASQSPDINIRASLIDEVINSIDDVQYDSLQTAELASTLSQESNMPIAPNISEYRDTLIIQKTVAPIQLDIVDKPQTTILAGSAREIKEHTVQDGDTVESIAEQYSISPETVRWANDIADAAQAEPGKVLKILPVSGVLVIAKKGDSVKAIATQTEADEEEVAVYNELDSAIVIEEGAEVIVPNGKPRKVPVVTFKTRSGSVSSNGGTPRFTFSPGNTYARGYCTWWAQNRRIQIGRPVPNRMGNAVSWARGASAAGYAVDGNPRSGDVIWHKRASTYAGHVAFVEGVNADGSLSVSDMNNPYWGRVTYRTVTPDEFGQYLFIH